MGQISRACTVPALASLSADEAPGVGGERATFEIRATLVHEGGIEAGHFKAVACWYGGWWLCDDARVVPCGGDALAGASADIYGAFYTRVS